LAISKDGRANAAYVTALGQFPNLRESAELREIELFQSFPSQPYQRGKDGADSGSAKRFAILPYPGVFQIPDSD
jgi:hypothetical protein